MLGTTGLSNQPSLVALERLGTNDPLVVQVVRRIRPALIAQNAATGLTWT